MPIRKPRRQTLQELAYPPVPAIGGTDLRADEKLLGLNDWEFGDHSTRYPDPASVLGTSADGSRWGGSSFGGSVFGGGSVIGGGSAIGSTVGGGSSLGVPFLIGSPKKSSVVSAGSSQGESTHHVKRKKPPSIQPEGSSGSPSKVGSPPRSSGDGSVKPGDIVPRGWSAAASAAGRPPVSTVSSSQGGSTVSSSYHTSSTVSSSQPSTVSSSQPSTVSSSLQTVTTLPSFPPPSAISSSSRAPPSTTSSSASKPPEKRTSQPPPSRPPPSAYSHTKSHSHTGPLASAPTLPSIAASPRSSIADIPPPSTAGRLRVTNTTSPLPVAQPPSYVSSARTTKSAQSSPARSAPPSSFLNVPQTAPYGFTPPPASAHSAPPSAVGSAPPSAIGSAVSSSTSPRSPRSLPVPPASTQGRSRAGSMSQVQPLAQPQFQSQPPPLAQPQFQTQPPPPAQVYSQPQPHAQVYSLPQAQARLDAPTQPRVRTYSQTLAFAAAATPAPVSPPAQAPPMQLLQQQAPMQLPQQQAPPPMQAQVQTSAQGSVGAWRNGVLSSGPRGWGWGLNGAPPAAGQPPAPAPAPSQSYSVLSQAYSAPAQTYAAPTQAYSTPSQVYSSQTQPYSATAGYNSAPLPASTSLRPPAARAPPTRSFSYDITGSNPAAQPAPYQNQAAASGSNVNLDGYMSAPDGDDAQQLQRARSKLRRKLTKSRGGGHVVVPAPAPAVVDTTAMAVSATTVAQTVPTTTPAMRTAPTASTSARTALNTTSAVRTAARTNPMASVAAQVIPSGGEALVAAQRAFVGTHRPAQERILWGLPLDRDARVRHAVSLIEGMKDALFEYGAEQYVQSRTRGAIICNADFHPRGHPNELAFDWITFHDAQKTLEPTLQKAIMRSDPSISVVVIVFLLSPSLNSLAIWRKSISGVPKRIGLAREVETMKRRLADVERGMTVRTGEDEEIPIARLALTDDPIPEDEEWSGPHSHRTLIKSHHPSDGRASFFHWGRSNTAP